MVSPHGQIRHRINPASSPRYRQGLVMHRDCFAAVLTLALTFAASAADWPQGRAPPRHGFSGAPGLVRAWPADGPPLRWALTDIGTGYSSPSVAAGRVYLQ